jgi:hypothetical protein
MLLQLLNNCTPVRIEQRHTTTGSECGTQFRTWFADYLISDAARISLVDMWLLDLFKELTSKIRRARNLSEWTGSCLTTETASHAWARFHSRLLSNADAA